MCTGSTPAGAAPGTLPTPGAAVVVDVAGKVRRPGIATLPAGSRVVDAIRKARPLVLEPIVNVQINTPAGKMGDIAGDISAKRGQISGTDSAAGGMVTISGRVPLSELNNYQARLKSVTAGQGSFVMELSHYEPVPATVQQHLAAQYQHVDEDQ